MQQLFHSRILPWPTHDSNGTGNIDLSLGGEANGTIHRGHYATCNGVGLRLASEQHNELISAHSTDQVIARNALKQSGRHDAKNVIAGFVTMLVVHVFELVQINPQQSKW